MIFKKLPMFSHKLTGLYYDDKSLQNLTFTMSPARNYSYANYSIVCNVQLNNLTD